MKQFAVWVVALGLFACLGCGSNQPQASHEPAETKKVWTVSEVRADRGHDTIETAQGGIMHVYFCAIVLECGDETISLLYNDKLPETLNLKWGDQYHLDRVKAADFDKTFNGYWLHQVSLQPVQ